MNNNYNSKSNSDESINNNDNDNNNIIYISSRKTELRNLFQNEGPIYEKLFCPMVVLRKGTLSLA